MNEKLYGFRRTRDTAEAVEKLQKMEEQNAKMRLIKRDLHTRSLE